MTDFQEIGTTHLLANDNDWNPLLRHGLEKTASYIIRKNGSYYESIKGGTATGAGTIAYGGVDGAGATSGATLKAVLQATINVIRGAVNHALTGLTARLDAHASIFFKDGLTLTAGNVDLADIDGLTLTGEGGTITISTNDSVVFDCTNSANLKISNLRFEVAATYHPDVVWFFSRDNSGASAEFNRFTDCIFEDTDSAGCDVSLLYIHATESMTLTRCWFRHNKNAVVFTGSNRSAITSTYKTVTTGSAYSCRGLTLLACAFTHTYWSTYYPYYCAVLEGQGETCFDDNCYFGLGGDTGAVSGNYAFYVDLTYGSCYTLNVCNSKFEGKAIQCGGATILTTLMGVHFLNNYFHREVGDTNKPYFDLNKVNTQISNWTMENNVFHTGLAFELQFPSTQVCKFNFTNCWTEPAVTFADYYDSDLIMWTKANATFTAFTRGTVRFLLNKGGTHSSGRSTGTGARQTIAHSLVATPNRTYLTLIYNDDSPPYVDLAADATNIYPLAPLNKDYYWVCEVTFPD
jgi:hypothetical protein